MRTYRTRQDVQEAQEPQVPQGQPLPYQGMQSRNESSEAVQVHVHAAAQTAHERVSHGCVHQQAQGTHRSEDCGSNSGAALAASAAAGGGTQVEFVDSTDVNKMKNLCKMVDSILDCLRNGIREPSDAEKRELLALMGQLDDQLDAGACAGCGSSYKTCKYQPCKSQQ
jgi:hypothetical protein